MSSWPSQGIQPAGAKLPANILISPTYLSLNHSGAVLWPQLVAGASRRQLVAELARAYDIAPAVAAADLELLLSQLADRELLTVGGPALGDHGAVWDAPSRLSTA